MPQLSFTNNFLLISILPQNISDEAFLLDNEETIRLIESYGGQIVDIVIQKREVHDKGNFIGKGKTEEVALMLQEKAVDIVLLNGIIPPGQIYFLQSFFEKFKVSIEVWDRVDLILKIFASHANTAEAKLQIELAAMRHMGPRIYGMGEEMSRQGGMVGTRGIGETNTERMKRHWREQTKQVKQELEKISQTRKNQLENRAKVGFPTVSLVGYTNAGKTSLFNLLTGKKKLVQDSLFVTLDTTTGKFFSQKLNKEILVSDTIGFINNLPPQLIDAFSSTLMESVHADILLQVIDMSDKDLDRKMETVDQILKQLRVNTKPRIYVFNKSDQISEKEKDAVAKKYAFLKPQFISVKTGEGIEDLKQLIGQQLIK